MKARREHGNEEFYRACDRWNVGNISQLTMHATRSRKFIRIPLLVESPANIVARYFALTFDIGTDTTSQLSAGVTLFTQSWRMREVQMLSHRRTEEYDAMG